MNESQLEKKTPGAPACKCVFVTLLGSKWLLCLLVLVAGLAWFGTNNGFKFYYHPDESGKVKQIATNKRNFHHPLLMLTTTRLMTRLLPGRPADLTYQQICVVGRWSSALFTTVSVLAVAMMAWQAAGRLAGWVAALLGLASPQLYEFAHYFKEDPALTAGMMLAFLSFFLFWKKQSPARLVFVGAACALALCGKYVGAVVVPFGVLVVALAPAAAPVKWRRLGVFLGVFVAVCALVNYPIFRNPSVLMQGLAHEKSGVLVGHRGLVVEAAPWRYYLAILTRETPPALLALVATGIACMLWRARRTTLPEWILLGCIVTLCAMLCSSPKVSTRYLLPVFAVFPYFTAVALGTLAGPGENNPPPSPARKVRMGLAIGLALFTAWLSVPVLRAKHHDFGCDDQGALREFVRKELPVSAVIAEDDRANLPTANRWEYTGEEMMPQKILRAEFVPDLGSLSELRAKGVTHVAICAPTYLRFFANYTPTESVKAEFDRRHDFYQALKDHGRVVWSAPPGNISYTRPGITLYDITALAPGGGK